jgi:hypothetical protein
MTTLLLTVCLALLTGFVGGKLHERRKKRKPGLQSWTAPRRDPEAVWAKWGPEIGRAIGKRS